MANILKNWFRKDKKEPIPAKIKTAPLDVEDVASSTAEMDKFTPSQVFIGTGQSTGLQRDHNEDTIFVLNSQLADGANEIHFGLYLVADGMGGYEYGEIASSVAARAASEYILSKIYLPQIDPNGAVPEETLQEIIETSVIRAQQLVKQKAPGGGTTLTAAVVVGERVTIAHVGDSRAYFLYPDGRMELLTHDHSLVHRLVELGQITEEEALVHPNRNVLYRALGQPEPLKPDIQSYPIPKPGYLLICSDGLWGSINDDNLCEIVKNAQSPSVACKKLVDAANEAGGPDNISVILVQYI